MGSSRAELSEAKDQGWIYKTGLQQTLCRRRLSSPVPKPPHRCPKPVWMLGDAPQAVWDGVPGFFPQVVWKPQPCPSCSSCVCLGMFAPRERLLLSLHLTPSARLLSPSSQPLAQGSEVHLPPAAQHTAGRGHLCWRFKQPCTTRLGRATQHHIFQPSSQGRKMPVKG